MASFIRYLLPSIAPTEAITLVPDSQVLVGSSQDEARIENSAGTRNVCVKPPSRGKILGGIGIDSTARRRARHTTWECEECNVPLCKDGICWEEYHNTRRKQAVATP